jgi:hypothetical protein
MPEEASDERQWLLEPPAAGEVHLHVELGEGAELDEPQRNAVETLITSLYGSEVSGFAFGDCTVNPPGCSPLRSCGPEYTSPCRIHECYLTDCKICSNKAASFL